MNVIAVYAGSIIIIIWGIAHIFPTAAIVKGFGEISTDNKRILVMEWVGAGLWMIFIGTLCLLITALLYGRDNAAQVVYVAASAMLLISAALGFFTGFRTAIIPIKLCPFVQIICALLLICGLGI